jgi:hypothetical protein
MARMLAVGRPRHRRGERRGRRERGGERLEVDMRALWDLKGWDLKDWGL